MKKKIIQRIALAELQSLFFSPVAWLVLIIFTFQVNMGFTGILNDSIKSEALNYHLSNLTFGRFSDIFGLFPRILRYLHLYIPLLTMGLVSREFSTGSIKLLYSSPVTNAQIILGKFLAMAVYGLLLLGSVFICVFTGWMVIDHADYGLTLCALLGFYLLILAYAAIGIFMSSLTSYQVIAAVATLTFLSVLNYIGSVGQSIDFVREITYWLSIKGRATQLIKGLLVSEDVLYFLIIMGLFITLSVLRLNAIRQKTGWAKAWTGYALTLVIALSLGYLSSRPLLMAYLDTTETKHQSLTKNSQEIVKQLDGGLTITTYVNIFDNDAYYGMPQMRKEDIKHFEKYIRFKPEMKMNYVYYYMPTSSSSMMYYNEKLSAEELMKKIVKNEPGLKPSQVLTPDEINKRIDLSAENYSLVRVLERADGRKTILRMFADSEKYPGEREISAAMKRLSMKRPPVVAFLQGHGERNFDQKGDRSYNLFAMNKPFRYALINQGFDFTVLTLDKPVPENIDILVIADMKQSLNPQEQSLLDNYISRGGNLMILGETGRQEAMNPTLSRLGVSLLPGRLVQKTGEDYQADFIVSHATPDVGKLSYYLMGDEYFKITMPGATALSYRTDAGFDVKPVLLSPDKNSWNDLDEVDLIDHTPVLDIAKGEKIEAHNTGLALTRTVGKKQQKIIVVGDADCISNGEISRKRPGLPASNFNLIMGGFNWLSDEVMPIDVRRPDPLDNKLNLGLKSFKVVKLVLMWGIPVLLLISYLIMWFRRRGR